MSDTNSITEYIVEELLKDGHRKCHGGMGLIQVHDARNTCISITNHWLYIFQKDNMGEQYDIYKPGLDILKIIKDKISAVL